PVAVVAEPDHLGVVLGEPGLPHRGELDPGGLEPGDGAGAGVPGGGVGPGDQAGDHGGLLPGGGDQAVHGPGVLAALADRVDRRVVGAQLVVDDDAPVDLEAGGAGEPGD